MFDQVARGAVTRLGGGESFRCDFHPPADHFAEEGVQLVQVLRFNVFSARREKISVPQRGQLLRAEQIGLMPPSRFFQRSYLLVC